MNIAFRTDASLAIGTGHAMRCLTLADALASRGAECHFICREHPGNLTEHIRRKGHTVHALPQAESGFSADMQAPTPIHAHWLGCDWQTDAAQTRAILAEKTTDWLIVDHYALDARWEKALRGNCGKIMVIDDLADRPHDCDLLLDQNLGRKATDYDALVPAHCQRLIGPRYALLRPEFAALRAYSLQRRRRQQPRLGRILVAMGGVDQPNATGQVLEALKTCPLPPDCRITVVMGESAPWLDQVRALAIQMPWPTEVLVNIDNMAQIMADSDLTIGAAGSSSWERCCLGLPTLLVVLAKNQENGAQVLCNSRAAKIIGTPELIHKNTKKILSDLLSNEDISDLSLNAQRLTDGFGSTRILKNIK